MINSTYTRIEKMLYSIKLWNIAYIIIFAYSLTKFFQDGILANYGYISTTHGLYANFLLYMTIFIVILNILNKMFKRSDIALFLAFSCIIASLGLFETVSFINGLTSRWVNMAELESKYILQGLTISDWINKAFINFFKLFRVAFYISANIPLLIVHKNLKIKSLKLSKLFFVLFIVFELINYVCILFGLKVDERFIATFLTKASGGLVYVSLVREWYLKKPF